MSCSGRYASIFLISCGVVRAGGVQPEHRRVAGGAGAGDGQLHPVADRQVLGLAHPEDVPGLDGLLEHGRARLVHHAHGALGGELEGLVVAAVLLGLLRHQADVRHRAHRGRVVGAMRLAVLDDGLVDARVAAVRNHGQGVRLLAVRAPHVSRGADHRGHRGVHDHVAGHVQVGDAPVGVDHGQRRALGDLGVERGLDVGAVRQRGQAVQDAAEAVVRAQARGGEVGAVRGEGLREERAHHVAEDDRVGDLHHGGLQVHGEEHVLGLGAGDLRGRGTPRSAATCMHGGVHDLALEHRHARLEHGHRAVAPRRARCAACPRRRRWRTSRWSGSRRGPSSRLRSSSRPTRRPCGAGGSSRSSSPTAGARRSELPSRSTGFTALPLTLS